MAKTNASSRAIVLRYVIPLVAGPVARHASGRPAGTIQGKTIKFTTKRTYRERRYNSNAMTYARHGRDRFDCCC